ncbi:uncharacterized protein DS421_8g240270 [Arachis hypogaea]|nr:uncharacterized protein DS421_8g240270 [Arachis hypogaea]
MMGGGDRSQENSNKNNFSGRNYSNRKIQTRGKNVVFRNCELRTVIKYSTTPENPEYGILRPTHSTSHGVSVLLFWRMLLCSWGYQSTELLDEVPDGHVGTTKYNIKLKWLKSRLQQMSLDFPEDAVVRYARCYIMYLLGGVLLPNKANNTVHVRYLPLLANYDAISTYSWGSAVLLHFWAPDVTSPYTFPLATTWAGKRGNNDYAEERLQKHRLRLDTLKVDEFVWMSYRDARILSRVPAEFLGAPHGNFYTAVVPLILFCWIEIVNIDKVMRQFGGKQGLPNPPLNIDTFHRQSARNKNRWWPISRV